MKAYLAGTTVSKPKEQPVICKLFRKGCKNCIPIFIVPIMDLKRIGLK